MSHITITNGVGGRRHIETDPTTAQEILTALADRYSRVYSNSIRVGDESSFSIYRCSTDAEDPDHNLVLRLSIEDEEKPKRHRLPTIATKHRRERRRYENRPESCPVTLGSGIKVPEPPLQPAAKHD